MGLTVAQTIEQAQEEILEAGGTARPAYDVEEGTITSSGTTLTLEGRQSYVPPDGVIEWVDDSMEIAEVKSVSSTTVTLQTRGYLGSTAASHADGVKVILDPPYPRYLLVQGLKAVIGQLRGLGGLFARGYTSSLTISTIAPVQLPAGAVDVLGVLFQNGANWFPLRKGSGYRVFYDYTGLDTPPALQFFQGFQGAATKIHYAKNFDTDPFTLTTDLDDVGIPDTLQPHMAQGLAGHVLLGRDVPQLESEHIRPDPQNPQQPGTRLNIGRALWTAFMAGPVVAARNNQLRQFPIAMVFERI